MTLLVPLVLSLIGKFAVLVTFTEVHCSPKWNATVYQRFVIRSSRETHFLDIFIEGGIV